MKFLLAVLAMDEDLESPIELRVYRNRADFQAAHALEIFKLTNEQVAELVVNQKLKVVRTSNDGYPIED